MLVHAIRPPRKAIKSKTGSGVLLCKVAAGFVSPGLPVCVSSAVSQGLRLEPFLCQKRSVTADHPSVPFPTPSPHLHLPLPSPSTMQMNSQIAPRKFSMNTRCHFQKQETGVDANVSGADSKIINVKDTTLM